MTIVPVAPAPPAPRSPSVDPNAPDTHDALKGSSESPSEPHFGNGMHARRLDISALPVAARRYLDKVHERIHEEFAFKGFDKLDALPRKDPANDPTLVTRVESIVSAKDGHIAQMEIVKPSGAPSFDSITLESLRRAQPFVAAPQEITSADGNVYLAWEFRRDIVYSCAMKYVQLYLLGGDP